MYLIIRLVIILIDFTWNLKNMARELLELNTEDGGSILVALEVPETSGGRVSKPGEIPIKKLDAQYSVIQNLILRACRPLTKAFKQLHQETQAADAEVEFAVNFTNKGSVYLVEASGQASLKVKVTWKLSQ
mgnify:CR=1 FL=1